MEDQNETKSSATAKVTEISDTEHFCFCFLAHTQRKLQNISPKLVTSLKQAAEKTQSHKLQHKTGGEQES